MDLPTYVLCLRELPERTAYIEQHLGTHGIKWTPWYGFPGVHMGLSTNLPYYTDGHQPTPCASCGNETAYRINPGTVAVTLSHLAILKHIVAAGLPEALIFENDVDLPPDFNDRFSAFYSNLPTGWDMAYLGWGSGNENWDATATKPVAPGVAIVPGGSMQTHAYMVSLKGAKFLDEHCQQAWRPIDVSYMLEGEGHLRTYFAEPKICGQLTASGRLDGSLHFDKDSFTLPEKPQGNTVVVADGVSWRYAEE